MIELGEGGVGEIFTPLSAQMGRGADRIWGGSILEEFVTPMGIDCNLGAVSGEGGPLARHRTFQSPLLIITSPP